jgi:CheY-like chemotaxis protein
MGGRAQTSILLVDDDAGFRDAVGRLLAANGYTTVAAADGHQALRVLRTSTAPALILLDLRMPVMDGPTFRAEQLRDPRLRSIPVLVVSADRTAAGDPRFRGVPSCPKPVDPDDLLRAVGRLVVTRVSIPVEPGQVGRREVRGRPLLRGRAHGRR